MTAALERAGAVRLRPLTYLPETDGVMVGCAQTDSYALLPPDGAALLEQLTLRPPDEAGRWYESTYGEPVDVSDFLDTVAELGFVDDGPLGPRHRLDRRAVGLRWQRTGRVLYSPLAGVVAAAVVVATLVAVVHDPALLPRTDHVFFSDYLLLIELTVAFGQVPLILLHEVCHVLAARRLGVPARIRVSHRMYFVVFETVMDGLVMVPRRRRYLPMLAGMLCDLLVVCVLTLVAGVAGTPSAVAGVCLALAFSTVVRFALEFLLFLRTDVYYLICTVVGTVDLHTTSSEILADAWWRLVRRRDKLHDPVRWHPTDVRAARWYTPVHAAGYLLAAALLALVLLPVSWRFLESAATQLLHPNLGSVHFWDALGLLLLNAAQPAAAALLWLRERAVRSVRPFTPSRGTP